MKIVYLDRPALPNSVTLRKLKRSHQWIDLATTSANTPEEIIERSAGADVLATNKVPITEQLLAACPSVQHIAVSATGYNCVDISACREHGVSVSNIPSYASTTVPEHVISLALALRRELLQYRAQVIAGKWQTSEQFCLFDKPIRDLKGSVFGVIGFGDLGRASARLAHALGMNVIFNSRSKKKCDFAQQVELDELLAKADVISLHCSLNHATANLIGAVELAQMQNHCVLINTARGGIVDEAAAAQALLDQQIGALGFDVLCQEPPVDGSPLLEIAHLNNVIITPHTAWASEDAVQRVADILVDNVEAFIAGQPQNIVS